jgi:tRNA-dihydrouridine synthase B
MKMNKNNLNSLNMNDKDINLSYKNKLILAPLAGINDPAFRLICKKYGADIVYSGMFSSEALIRNIPVIINELKVIPQERPLIIQLFGSDEKNMLKASYIVKPFCDGIDINCGCPDDSVMKQGAGSKLLEDPKKIINMYKKIKNKVKIPVSVKIRIGIDKYEEKLVKEIALGLEKAGCDALTIHPRTSLQSYTGKADWKIIKEIKNLIKIPIIGNGDIKTCFDAEKMYNETGCDSIMIGREAMRNPFIFLIIKEYLKNKKILKFEKKDKINLLLEYFYYLEKYDIKDIPVKNRSLMLISGFEGSTAIRKDIYRLKTIDEIRNKIKIYL